MYSPIDAVFDEGNIYQPDLIYLSAERGVGLSKDRIEGAPDIAIEICSPLNAYYDLWQKKEIYEKYRVKEYLVFDPKNKNAHIYSLQSGVYILKQKAARPEALKSGLLPGLEFDLAKIFG